MRYLLFTDNFQPYSTIRGSAGGCYLIPLQIPIPSRHGVHSIRVIGCKPPGISSNEVINCVVDNIVECTAKGITIIHSDGGDITLFLDVVGYIGDYVGVAHDLDVLGVNANCPCPLCLFQKATVEDNEYSSYAYSSSTHNGDPPFRRDKHRMKLRRSICTTPDDYKKIGLQRLDETQRCSLPLHRLSDALEEARVNVPLTEGGSPVVPA